MRFYFGYEVGLATNFLLGGGDVSDTYGDEYTLNSAMVATMALMGKHGYRRNIGPAEKGLGFGIELGVGIIGGIGSIEFEDDDSTYGADTEVVSPVLELTGEFSVRTEKDLRFMTRLGIMVGAPVIDFDDSDVGIESLSGEAPAVRFVLRFGFVRDYGWDY